MSQNDFSTSQREEEYAVMMHVIKRYTTLLSRVEWSILVVPHTHTIYFFLQILKGVS